MQFEVKIPNSKAGWVQLIRWLQFKRKAKPRKTRKTRKKL